MTDKNQENKIRRPREGKSASTEKQRPTKKAPKKPIRPKPARRLGSFIFKGLLTLAVVGFIAGCVGAYLVFSYFAQDLPPTDSLKNYRPKTVSFIYSDDGREIGEFSDERRIVVPLAKIPEHVRNAFLAAEDANFYHHPGIDLESIARAAIKNFQAGEIKQGGSTITQQVARAFLLTNEKSYRRKIREAILAYRIDNNLTKDEILYLYLNHIFLGNHAYGVESAAQMYFDKHVDQLSIAEAAILAGLPQAPSNYSPNRNPKAARNRQIYVINQMLEKGFINQQQHDQAINEELVYRYHHNPYLKQTPFFTEHVRRLLVEKYGEDRLNDEGFRVYTTVNIEYQAMARKAVGKGLREFTKRRPYHGPLKHLEPEEVDAFLKTQAEALAKKPYQPGEEVKAVVVEVDARKKRLNIKIGDQLETIEPKDLQWALRKGHPLNKLLQPGDLILVMAEAKEEKKREAAKNEEATDSVKPVVLKFTLEQEPKVHSALMSINNEDGAVKAMVGGRDFAETQFNRAVQSRRQPGSSFKPVIYTAAMDNGFTPGSILIDAPIVYDDFAHGRRWKPTNFDRKFYGPTDLYTGLTSSRNVMAIKLLSLVGYPAVFETAKKLGITSPLVENLTLALGSVGVSLEEMVSAYTTFANLGERVEPMYITRIEDRNGRVIEEVLPTRIRAISSGTACVIQHMLMGVVQHGTGVRVRALGRPTGGKTGTTNDLADAWFIGFTPEYTTGVWVGLDSMKRMGWGESGGRAAAPIFLYYMQDALADQPIRDFVVPPDATIVNNGSVGICYKKGTEGTGYSETGPAAGDEFLKSDLSDFDVDKEM